MRSLDDYINVAVIRNNFSSKREFCKALGLSPNATTTYKNGTLPSEVTMEKIAMLAGIDKETAILELGYWRTAGTAAQKTYASLLQKIGQVTAALLIMLGSLVAPQSAEAMNKSETLIYSHNTEYTLSHIWTLLLRWFLAPFNRPIIS